MSPINHLLTGWLLANTVSTLTMRERGYITLAAVAADIDGLGIVAEVLTRDSSTPLLWWSQYHHVLAHNLLFGCVLVMLVFFLTQQHRWLVALLVFFSFHLHLVEDILSGRDSHDHAWGIAYLYPFSDQQWVWLGQWQLNAWPNMVVALFLMAVTLFLAWKRSYSPLAIFSNKADQLFVQALQQRFGKP